MRAAWVVVWLLLGCGFAPEDEEPFIPPDRYRAWWHDLEFCAQRSGDFDRITWIKADLHGELGHRHGRTIWVDRDYLATSWVIKHEALHTMIGDHHHRSPIWAHCNLGR